VFQHLDFSLVEPDAAAVGALVDLDVVEIGFRKLAAALP
jgi:hypothetical protein